MIHLAEQMLCTADLPMLWNVADPGDTGSFEANVGVETASHGVVNDDLLLLFQQLD
jgi:hypothetical protein